MKKIYLLLATALCGLLIWGLFFYPVRVTKKIKVAYSMFKSGEQLNNAANVAKWYIPFSVNETSGVSVDKKNHVITSGDHSAKISDITTFSSLLKTKYKGKQQFFSFTAIIDSTDGSATEITLSYTCSLFRKWFIKSTLEKNAEKSLENLKDYMTDTRRFYGFEIQKTTVEDTAFLFTKEVCTINERKAITKKIFENLIAYANAKNAGYNGTRLYYTIKEGNELTIFASIGVTNLKETPESGEIEYKEMPFGKNLLVTTYQGPFMQAEKAYKALEAFKKDHDLTDMAIPFQKFMSDGYDFDDNQVVQLKVCYPIF